MHGFVPVGIYVSRYAFCRRAHNFSLCKSRRGLSARARRVHLAEAYLSIPGGWEADITYEYQYESSSTSKLRVLWILKRRARSEVKTMERTPASCEASARK